MMKAVLLIIVLAFGTLPLKAQTKFGNEWIISMRGYNINFNNPPPTHDTIFVLNTEFYGRGHSNICDSTGNIIFSCDGMDVYDSNFNLMDNGDTLVPHDFYVQEDGWSAIPQTSLILPMENRKYYLITPTVSDNYLNTVWPTKPAGNWNYDLLLYHVVDMNANAGAGKVVQKKVPLMTNTPMKKTQMMACKHANGKDWWLLKMAGDSNMVFTFLFTQDSVIKYPNQYIPFPHKGTNDSYGQMQFSQDGKKWATTCSWASETTYVGHGETFVADFDRCTGKLSNYQLFVAPPVLGDSVNLGLSFSPNGKLLYIAKLNYIQQLNLKFGTWYTVHGPDSPAYFCGYTSLHLAPDNKIYIGRFHGICKQLSVIDSPDVEINCAFCVNCLRSKSNYGYFSTPPTMPNYELGAELPCWPLGTDDVKRKEEDFVVYPNPASTILHIIADLNKVRELYNSVGQLIMSTRENELNVSHLTGGVYYLKCGNAARKIIIE